MYNFSIFTLLFFLFITYLLNYVFYFASMIKHDKRFFPNFRGCFLAFWCGRAVTVPWLSSILAGFSPSTGSSPFPTSFEAQQLASPSLSSSQRRSFKPSKKISKQTRNQIHSKFIVHDQLLYWKQNEIINEICNLLVLVLRRI